MDNKIADSTIYPVRAIAHTLSTLGTRSDSFLRGVCWGKVHLAGLLLAIGLSTATPVQAFDIVSIVASCGQLVPGVPGVACVCQGQAGNLAQIARGEIFCSTIGWTGNYPIQILEACPYRVNRYWPDPDGCGSAISGTVYWLPQTFLGIVDFGSTVCANHDRCFSQCQSNESGCNDQWRADTDIICGGAFPDNDEYSLTLLGWCKTFGETYLTGIIMAGAESYDEAQKQACQCGPDVPCMGGVPRWCINCPFDPGGQGGGIFLPSDPDPFDPCPGGC